VYEVLNLLILDNNLNYVDRKHLPKNDQKQTLLENGSLNKEELLRLFYLFLIKLNALGPNQTLSQLNLKIQVDLKNHTLEMDTH
jgi:hypothetical protein